MLNATILWISGSIHKIAEHQLHWPQPQTSQTVALVLLSQWGQQTWSVWGVRSPWPWSVESAPPSDASPSPPVDMKAQPSLIDYTSSLRVSSTKPLHSFSVSSPAWQSNSSCRGSLRMRLGHLLIMDEHSYETGRDSDYTICRPLTVS